MKKIEQFLSDLNGNFCEVSGSANAKNQCVDLANAYLRDVCNHPIIQWTNACDFPSKIKDMEWIPNDEETDLPKEGDIVIWNSSVGGGAGHIAIFLEGNTSKFNSFDQNWPLYSPCHVQSHNYTNVIGWLRPNGIIQEDMTDEQKKVLGLINDNGLSEGDLRWLVDLKKNNTVSILEGKVKDLETKIDGLNTTISDQYKEMDKKNLEYGKLLEKYNTLLPKYEELLKDEQNQQTTNTTANKFNLIDFIKSLLSKWKK